MGVTLLRARIAALFPHALPGHIDAFATHQEALFAVHGVDRGRHRLEFFLAQIGHESCGLSQLSENLNYSAERLMQVWPRRFPTLAAAKPYARNPEALANFTYGGRMGNGLADSGDGWRFRGRGYVQLTGREGYREVGRACGLDLEADPALAVSPDHALAVALGFWTWKRANSLCDTGDFERLTLSVNGGKTGWTDRVAWLERVRRVLATAPRVRTMA